MRHRPILLLSLLFALLGAASAHAQDASRTDSFEFPREWFYLGEDDEMWKKMNSVVGKSVDVLGFNVRDWSGVDPDHGTLSPKLLSGRVVVLNFWRTNDEISIDSIPRLNELFTEFENQGVEVIGIAAERGSERMADIIESEGICYVTARDTHRTAAKAFGLEWHPWTVLIDRKGIVRATGLRCEHVSDAVQLILDAQPATRKIESKTLRVSPNESAEPGDTPNTDTQSTDTPAQTVEPIPEEWIEAGYDRRKTLSELLGKRPPTLEVKDWRNSFPLRLRERRGDVIMLFFFDINHETSTRIAKAVNSYYLTKKDEGLTVIGIADTVSGEALTNYINKHDIEFRVAMDIDRATINKYQVNASPDFYFIDRRGLLRAADVKSPWITEVTELLLAETP